MTLDEFVDESIRQAVAAGYHPTKFMSMREDAKKQRRGVASVIAHLVESSEPRSGFVRMVQIGLAKDWSLEAGVVKFPEQFSPRTLAYARARLEGTFDASPP